MRPALTAALTLAIPVTLATAYAQSNKSERLDALKQRDQELQSLQGEQKKAADTEAALKRAIETLGADRRKLARDLLDTAARVRTTEDAIAATETRIKPLDEDERTIRKSLEARRAVIAEILAAMQRVGHRPPPALLVNPEDALRSVRAAIVLGAVLPDMRQKAEAVATDLGELLRVRKQIAAERDKLKSDIAALNADKARMTALVDERQKQQNEREKELASERSKAVALAQQASSLQDLIAKLEQGLDTSARAAREAARQPGPSALSTLRDPGRLAPAIAFASLKGRVPVPVNGVRVKEYGANDGLGSTERGLSVATRSGAQVTAPADGWVVYAGPFRSYGQLLILNAGGGYHILLAGMERISVDLGQFVLAGEPVAAMGSGSHISAVLATGSSQPVLYVEFRKDGSPVDPGPWWATGEGEKAARG